jgi:hypothetical protein
VLTKSSLRSKVTHPKTGRAESASAGFAFSISPRPTLAGLAAEVAKLREAIQNTPRFHRKDLLQRWGICQRTLTNWITARRIPRPIRIAGPLWTLAQVEAAEAGGRLKCPCPAESGSFQPEKSNRGGRTSPARRGRVSGKRA